MSQSRLAALTLALGLVAGACSSGSDAATAPGTTAPRSTSAPTTAPSSTTSTGPTTTTTTEAPFPGLRPGMTGERVLALQERLNAIKYPVGTVDGKYGGLTAQAVMAFQKANGLGPTGEAPDELIAQIMSGGPPAARIAGGEPTRVEIDRDHQIMLVFHQGSLHSVLNVSSGSGIPYCENGYCGDARTPAGAFRIGRRIGGWRVSPLGRLYNPLYFNGGIAIHGSHSVPGYPASHGCVRINMAAAEWLPGLVPNGTPVYVIGGGVVPAPLSGRTPPSTDPPPETTSSTPAPTSSTTSEPTTTTSPTTSTTTTSTPTSTTLVE